MMKATLAALLAVYALFLCGCRAESTELEESLVFLLNSKALAETYASKLKTDLPKTDERLIALKGKYEKAQKAVNRTVQSASIALSANKRLSDIALLNPATINSIRDYSKYADATLQAQVDDKGLLTQGLKWTGQRLTSLFTGSAGKTSRTALITKLENECLWVAWDEI